MAATGLQDKLARQFRADQVAVTAEMARITAKVWDDRFVIGSARSSWGSMRPLLVAAVKREYLASVVAGKRYYAANRIVMGYGPLTINAKPPAIKPGQLDGTLDAAGLYTFLKRVGSGYRMMDASTTTRDGLGLALGTLAQGGARDWITIASDRDPASDGWSRIVAGTCDFCEELAAQGVHVGDFEAHNNCQCTAEPSFRDDYKPMALTGPDASDEAVASEDSGDGGDGSLSGLLDSLKPKDAAISGADDVTDLSDIVEAVSKPDMTNAQAMKLLKKWIAEGAAGAGALSAKGKR